MTFEEFLKKMNMSAAEFQDLPQATKDYINASFYATAQKATAAEEEVRQQALKDETALEDKRSAAENARKQAYYEKWHSHFAAYGGNLAQEGYKAVSDKNRAQQQEVTNERKKQALAMARRRCSNDLERLLFAEADAMDTSLKLESWERMIPVGNQFADELDMAKIDCTGKKKLSDAMKDLNPTSVDHAMYSRLLMRYDDDPKVTEMNSEEIARDMFKNSPDSYKFYQEHRMDNVTYANSENLDFTMKEMFRLGDRMSRNSRMSKPMKELCAKINSLKKDYTANPGKYADMPRGRLNHLMQSIGFAADAYTNDKKSMKSFSSTQLERLKCINQLKTLQECFATNANEKNFAYSMTGNHMDTGYAYPATALAEKIVLASFVETKQGAGMCDRSDMQDRAQKLMENPDYRNFVAKVVDGTKAAKGADYPLEKIYDSMLKTNGQAMVKAYRQFQNDAFRRRTDEMFNKKENSATNETVVENAKSVKKTGGMVMNS